MTFQQTCLNKHQPYSHLRALERREYKINKFYFICQQQSLVLTDWLAIKYHNFDHRIYQITCDFRLRYHNKEGIRFTAFSEDNALLL